MKNNILKLIDEEIKDWEGALISVKALNLGYESFQEGGIRALQLLKKKLRGVK